MNLDQAMGTCEAICALLGQFQLQSNIFIYPTCQRNKKKKLIISLGIYKDKGPDDEKGRIKLSY